MAAADGSVDVGRLLMHHKFRSTSLEEFRRAHLFQSAPLRADSAAHTVRQWCQRHASDDGKVILKLDSENALWIAVRPLSS